jgi:hypothetical protein
VISLKINFVKKKSMIKESRYKSHFPTPDRIQAKTPPESAAHRSSGRYFSRKR